MRYGAVKARNRTGFDMRQEAVEQCGDHAECSGMPQAHLDHVDYNQEVYLWR